jgi:hypothetical protein
VTDQERAELLAAVRENAAELDAATATLNGVLGLRKELFQRLRDDDPPTPLGVIREAAGLGTNEAVAAVLRRARKESTKPWR